jgi:transposase
MGRYTPAFKHRILTLYRRRQRGLGFGALASAYGVIGGRRTVQRWYAAWDGTVKSLNERARSGRPRTLTSAQSKQYIGSIVRRKNRTNEPVNYWEVYQFVRDRTGKNPSIRTIRRYGKEQLRLKWSRTKKVTQWEGKRTADTEGTRTKQVLMNVSCPTLCHTVCLFSQCQTNFAAASRKSVDRSKDSPKHERYSSMRQPYG